MRTMTEIPDVPDFVGQVSSQQNIVAVPTNYAIDRAMNKSWNKFEVDRPDPPRRRRFGQGSFYEWVFFFLALISWPICISVHIIVVAGIRIQSFGMDNTWSANQQGLLIVLPVYLFSSVCTYCCYKLDQAAREGDIYAKEKAAYHADMDQWLKVKEAYYKRLAREVEIDSDE